MISKLFSAECQGFCLDFVHVCKNIFWGTMGWPGIWSFSHMKFAFGNWQEIIGIRKQEKDQSVLKDWSALTDWSAQWGKLGGHVDIVILSNLLPHIC